MQKGANMRNQARKVLPRKRRLPHIYADTNRLDENLMRILDEEDERLTVYVYRARHDWPVSPYLRKCHPYSELEADIRDDYGAGQYAIIIREGQTMIFSGTMAIGVPQGWRAKA